MLGQLQWKSRLTYRRARRNYPVKTGLQNSGTDTKADTCEALVSVLFQAMPDKIQWNCLKISR